MNDSYNLRDTIIPKSNQLNADDLIAGPMTITVTKVSRGSAEQPVNIDYAGGEGRPYKPCKSMRRVLIHAWGDDGREWAGKRMTLYCDPSVKFGGVQVGGIRISHLSDIPRTLDIALTATRGKRTPYSVQPLVTPDYPADKFHAAFPKMAEAIRAGKMTPDQVISQCEKTGELTDEMRMRIRGAAVPPELPSETENEEM